MMWTSDVTQPAGQHLEQMNEHGQRFFVTDAGDAAAVARHVVHDLRVRQSAAQRVSRDVSRDVQRTPTARVSSLTFVCCSRGTMRLRRPMSRM